MPDDLPSLGVEPMPSPPEPRPPGPGPQDALPGAYTLGGPAAFGSTAEVAPEERLRRAVGRIRAGAEADPLASAVAKVRGRREQQSQFQAYVAAHGQDTPQENFEALSLAAATGADPLWVARNRDLVRSQVDKERMARTLADNPVLREFLEDPSRLQVLKGDVENVSWLTRYITGQLEHGFKSVVYGLTSSLDAAGLKNPLSAFVVPGTPLAGAVESLGARVLGGLEEDLDRSPTARMGLPARVLTAPLRMAPYIAGAVVSRAAGGVAGASAGPVGALAGGWVAGSTFDITQNVGPLYRRMVRLGVDEETARQVAWSVSVPLGMATGALGSMAPGIKDAVGGLTGQAMAKTLTNVTLQDLQRQAGLHLAKDVGIGVTAMTAQAAANASATQFALGTSGLPQDWDQVKIEVGEAAKQALTDLSLLATVSAGYRYLGDRARIVRTQQSKAYVEALTDTAKASEAVQKFSPVVQALLAKAKLEKGAVKEAFIGIEAWDRYWQDKKQDPAAVATAIASDEGAAYREAHESGDLRLPIEAWLAKVAGSEHALPLNADTRLYADALTPKQGLEFEKMQAKMADEALKAEPEAAQRLYDDFYAMGRVSLGQTSIPRKRIDAVADASAKLYQKIVATVAKREGWTIDDASARLGVVVRIRAGDQGARRAFGQPAPGVLPDRMAILEAVAKADEAGRHDGLVPIAEVRTASGLPRETFDRLLLEMERAGQADLKIANDPRKQWDGIPTAGRGGHPAGSEFAFVLHSDRVLTKIEGETILYQGERGFITVGGTPESPRFSIHLLENADETTLAHETAHFFGIALGNLAQRADVSEALKRDYRILIEAMGFTDHADRLAAGVERRALEAKPLRTAEEQDRVTDLRGREEWLAHAWEQYLAEGRAPTEELRGVFGRFARWMKAIYKSLDTIATSFKQQFGHDLELSDGVRGVFDRLLGTDEEISTFRGEAEPHGPAFADVLAAAPDAERPALAARAKLFDTGKIREAARQAIAERPISTLNLQFYAMAARRAAEASAMATDAQERFAAREQQYLSESIYRAARDAKREAEKVRGRLQRYTDDAGLRAKIGKATVTAEDGSVSQPYLDRIDSLLSAFELGASASRAEVGRRQATIDWIGRERAEGREPFVPESVLRKLDRTTHWTDLSIGELKDLQTAVKSIAHQAELKTTLVERGKRVDKANGIAELAAGLEQNFKQRPIPAQRQEPGALTTAGYALLRPENLIREIDGGRIDGPASRLLFEPLKDASLEWIRTLREAANPLGDILNKLPATDLQRFRKYRFRVLDQEYTLEAALAVALNWGNDSNRRKLVEGWQRQEVSASHIRPWSGDTPQEFLQHLSKRDWDIVQSIWDSFESMWPRADAMETRLTGVKPTRVEPKPFTVQTSDGQEVQIKGGYYPVIYDRRFSRQGASAAADPLAARNFLGPMTQQGYLIDRIEGFARPVALQVFDLLPRKLSEQARDVAMREALISVNSILTDQRMVTAMLKAGGDGMVRYLQRWVLDVAGDLRMPDNGAGWIVDWMNKLRGGYIASIFAWNVGQTLQNLTGMIPATNAVGAKWMGRSLMEFVQDRKGTVEFITGLSADMRERKFTGTDLGIDVLAQLGKRRGLDQRLSDFGMAIWEATDKAVAFPTWLAAFRRAEAEGLSRETAVRVADRTVRLHVMSGGEVDKAPIQRGTMGRFLRWAVPLYGWASNRANQMYSAVGDARRAKTAGEATKIIGGTIAALVAEQLFSELVTGKGPDDLNEDGKIDANDGARWALLKTALVPFGWLPLVKQVTQVIDSGRKDVSVTPEVDFFNTAGHVLTGTGKHVSAAVAGEQVDSEELLRTFGDLASLVGYWRGLPVIQTRRTAGFLNAVGTGEDIPSNSFDFGLGLAYGKKRPGSLRQALE